MTDATFDKWWTENEQQFSSDALHMSEYHMASVVWAAAVAAERKRCANAVFDSTDWAHEERDHVLKGFIVDAIEGRTPEVESDSTPAQ